MHVFVLGVCFDSNGHSNMFYGALRETTYSHKAALSVLECNKQKNLGGRHTHIGCRYYLHRNCPSMMRCLTHFKHVKGRILIS